MARTNTSRWCVASVAGTSYARSRHDRSDLSAAIDGGRDGKGRDGVFKVDVQTGDVTAVLFESRLGTQPRWSIDGTRIYYRPSGAPRIVERDLTSGAEREIYAGSLMQFETSPDGRMVAVQTGADRAGSGVHDRRFYP